MATRKKTTAKKRKTRRKPVARNPNSKSDQIRALLKTGVAPVDIAKKVGCSLPLVYQVRGRGKKSKGNATRSARRPRTAPSTGPANVLAAVQQVESERERLRDALERVQALVATALA